MRFAFKRCSLQCGSQYYLLHSPTLYFHSLRFSVFICLIRSWRKRKKKKLIAHHECELHKIANLLFKNGFNMFFDTNLSSKKLYNFLRRLRPRISTSSHSLSHFHSMSLTLISVLVLHHSLPITPSQCGSAQNKG